jgi:hypothetical protein
MLLAEPCILIYNYFSKRLLAISGAFEKKGLGRCW